MGRTVLLKLPEVSPFLVDANMDRGIQKCPFGTASSLLIGGQRSLFHVVARIAKAVRCIPLSSFWRTRAAIRQLQLSLTIGYLKTSSQSHPLGSIHTCLEVLKLPKCKAIATRALFTWQEISSPSSYQTLLTFLRYIYSKYLQHLEFLQVLPLKVTYTATPSPSPPKYTRRL